jgi:hypothetical protein
MGTDWVKVTLQIVGGLSLGMAVLSFLSAGLSLLSRNGAQAGISVVWVIVFATAAAGLFGFARLVANK